MATSRHVLTVGKPEGTSLEWSHDRPSRLLRSADDRRSLGSAPQTHVPQEPTPRSGQRVPDDAAGHGDLPAPPGRLPVSSLQLRRGSHRRGDGLMAFDMKDYV